MQMDHNMDALIYWSNNIIIFLTISLSLTHCHLLLSIYLLSYVSQAEAQLNVCE